MATDPKKPPAPKSTAASLISTLGTVALVIGAGALGYYMLDGHSHCCESCGHTWRHLGVFNFGDPGAHSCCKCGTTQWWKDGVQQVFKDALREPPKPPTLVPSGEKFPRLA